jgi:hypothetical protein
MVGPRPSGFWTQHGGQPDRGPFGPLQIGRRYRVTTAFVDYDDAPHPVGELWRFVGWNYSAYDNGLSVFVSLDDHDEWHIRLLDYPDAQGAICAHPELWLEPADEA